MVNLPVLTPKQQKFVLYYLTNGGNASDAYKRAYDCKNMSAEAIATEASRLLKNPKVARWVEYSRENVNKVFEDEIKYTAKDCFTETEEMKRLALSCADKYGNPNVNAALKAVELKGKLAGLFVDRHEVKGAGLADVLDKLQ